MQIYRLDRITLAIYDVELSQARKFMEIRWHFIFYVPFDRKFLQSVIMRGKLKEKKKKIIQCDATRIGQSRGVARILHKRSIQKYTTRTSRNLSKTDVRLLWVTSVTPPQVLLLGSQHLRKGRLYKIEWHRWTRRVTSFMEKAFG